MKAMVFYTIAGTIIGLLAEVAGLSIAWVLFLSLFVPPVILLVLALLRNSGYVS